MCFLTSCQTFRSKELSETNDKLEILEETAQSIIKAFEENDLTMLKTVLSRKALETIDLEEGFAYSCELLESDIAKIEQKGCPIEAHFDSGKSSKKADASFNITTESGKRFNLFFEYWYTNEFDESQIGVNRIKVSNRNEAMSDPNFKPGRLYNRSGIYNPAWDLTE